MASYSTPPLTEKEIREIYETFSKKKLIDILVEQILEKRKLLE